MIEKIIRDFFLLFATIDPLGTLAVFFAFTRGLARAERQKIALRAVAFSSFILIGAIIVGQLVLSVFHIQLISFQMAGGVILFLFGLKMTLSNKSTHEDARPESGHDLAIYPMAVPVIANPGALVAAIISSDNNIYTFLEQMLTVVACLVVLAITYVFLLQANRIEKVLGKNGILVLEKIMGMIVCAISVQLIMEAIMLLLEKQEMV